MERIKTLLSLLLIITALCGCNSVSNRTKDTQKNEIAKENFSNEAYVTKDNKPTTEDLYSVAETIIESQGKLRSDSSTMIKQIKDTIGGNSHEIYCYFTKDRLVSVENRFYNENGKPASFMMFGFDEKNSCFLVYRKESEKDKPLFYIFYNDSVMVHNNKFSKFLDDSLMRKKIILEAQKALELNMKRFPEFKYSFNWK